MTRQNRNIIVIVVILALVAGTIYAVTAMPNFPKMRAIFSQVKQQDTKERVVALMGKPSEVSDCHFILYSEVSQDLKDSCFEMYWYYGFLERWDVVFDRDGRVISKGYSVSP